VCAAQAYLKADVGVLQQHCSPECVERMAGVVRAEQSQEARARCLHTAHLLHAVP
jgi:hypothetical protein